MVKAEKVSPEDLRLEAGQIRRAAMVLESKFDSDVDGESPDTKNLRTIVSQLEREALGFDNLADALEEMLAQR